MDERTYWGWAITGLGGAINILHRLNSGGAKITQHFLGELKKAREELEAIIKQQEAKVSD